MFFLSFLLLCCLTMVSVDSSQSADALFPDIQQPKADPDEVKRLAGEMVKIVTHTTGHIDIEVRDLLAAEKAVDLFLVKTKGLKMTWQPSYADWSPVILTKLQDAQGLPNGIPKSFPVIRMLHFKTYPYNGPSQETCM